MNLTSMQDQSEPESGSTSPAAPSGRVLYDDSCGFCRRWVPYWEQTLQRRGFAIGPLQAPWVAEKLALPADEVVRDLRLLLPDGNWIVGANAYRYVMRRIWWAYPLYLLAITPVLRAVFDWSYRNFADHRHAFSRTCGLPGAKKTADD